MFNLFKKAKDPANCYLIQSNVFDKRELEEDTLDQYDELLKDEGVDDFLKTIINDFFKPFEISLFKFTLNMEFYETPFPTDLNNNHSYIAPSLREIKENPFEMALGYPGWFIAAFPDVSLWVMRSGKKKIMDKFRNYTEEQLIENKHIRLGLLKEIINMYLKTTRCDLECLKY